MRSLRITLLFLLFFTGVSLVFCQEKVEFCFEDLPQEQIQLVTDKQVFIVGEEIHFKIFIFTDGKLASPLSRVIYFELFNDQGISYEGLKFATSNGLVVGKFTIPENASTSYYFLRAFSKYGYNDESGHPAYQLIKIINPEMEGRSLNLPDTTNKETTLDINSDIKNQIFIQTEKSHYLKREPITVKIEVPNAEGLNASVSIRHKLAGLSDDRNYNEILQLNSWLYDPSLNTNFDSSSTFVIPEFRGITISGHVVDESGIPAENMLCYLSILGETRQFHMDQTDSEGKFNIAVQELSGLHQVYVGIDPKEEKQYQIQIDKDFNLAYPEMHMLPLQYDSTEFEFYQKRYLSSFFAANKQAEPKNGLNISNLGSFDITQYTKDFINFSTVREILQEIIPGVTIRDFGSTPRIFVYHKNSMTNHSDPLILIDHIPVFDIKEILGLNASEIEKIDVLYSKYYFGEYPVNGIISIHSKNQNFASYPLPKHTAMFDYEMLEEAARPLKKIYLAEEKNVDSRIPDLRDIVYWDPLMEFSSGSYICDTRCSDLSGAYEIVVEGYDQFGNHFMGTAEFIVK